MANPQYHIWNVIYSTLTHAHRSSELQSVCVAIEQSIAYDTIDIYVRVRHSIADILSMTYETILLDRVCVAVSNVTEVMEAVYGREMIRKTRLLSVMRDRSKDGGIVASDILAIVLTDYIKCRGKCPYGASELDKSPIKSDKAGHRNTSKKKNTLADLTGRDTTSRVSPSISVLKTAEKYNRPTKVDRTDEKINGRSLTPSKHTNRVTINLDNDKYEDKQESKRLTLGELNLIREVQDHNQAMIKKPRCGGQSGKKPAKSVFLKPVKVASPQSPLKAAMKFKDQMEYHLHEIEYQKQISASNKKKDIFKDKQAML